MSIADEKTALRHTEPIWQAMDTAPKDGREILLLIIHENFRYAPKSERGRWREVVVARWIEHNNGGWTWHGMMGRPIAWAKRSADV